MARILIVEPHVEVRELLERVVRRLGSEPVRPSPDLVLREIDAAVVEPAGPRGEEAVRALHEAGVPTVYVSIYPPTPEIREYRPLAYLLKPFSLAELEEAILAATAASPPARASAGASPE
jgi:CheY-like chemotaxis protein